VANTASAKQRIRNSARKAQFNRLHRSRTRTAVKTARELVAAKDLTAAGGQIVTAMSLLDKTAGKGVIHKNAAARKKSRLAKLLNKATAAKK